MIEDEKLVRATPLADELAAGHIGRLRLLNNQGTNNGCIALLRKDYARRGLGAPNDPVAHVVATLCDVPIDTYLRQHTMLPFTAFACAEKLRTPNGSWISTVVTRSGLLTPRQGGYACPACVAEDHATRTISYWRRTHQLPSELWCNRHPSIALVHIDHPRPFEQLPGSWLESEHAKPGQPSGALRESKFWLAFQDACQTMLQFGHNLPARQVRCAISTAAIAAGLRTTSNGKRAVLSDLLLERAPLEVVKHVFPDLPSKTVGAYINAIDEAAHRHSDAPQSTATATAIALLFKRASDALIAFQNVPPQAIAPKLSITKAFLRLKGDVREIARALGVSESDARKRLQGMWRHIHANTGAERCAIELFALGTPLTVACEKHDADRELVENLIRGRLRKGKTLTLA